MAKALFVERGGKPICQISPPAPVGFAGAYLPELLRSLPRPDAEYLALVEGLITNQAQLEKLRYSGPE